MANPKNINSLQLLRNETLFSGKTEAINAISGAPTNDGTIKLARYQENGTGDVKTIFGISYKADGASGSTYTIYDSPQEVIQNLKDRVGSAETAINTLNGDSGTTGSVANSIQTAIEALDVTWEGGTGKVITAITETDGKIAATYTDLSAGNVAAPAVTADDNHVAVESGTVESQIASLAASIKTTVKDAKSYKIHKLTADEIAHLDDSANIKEAYQLFDEKDQVSGETIKIYKDSSLSGVTFSDQKLHFTYILANGSASTVSVDVSDFLAENEFSGGGLQVVDHVVGIKLAQGSEKFLTVGNEGLKLSGITEAISSAISGLDKTVSGASSHVTVTVGQEDGLLSGVTIQETDIASARALSAETSAREAADNKIVTSVGFNTTGDTYVIPANPSADTGKTLTGNSDTVAKALYTLDNAIAAAKKANNLTAADKTVVVDSSEAGTTVKVNIETIDAVSNFVGYKADGTFVKSEIFAGIDAGTY